MILNFYSFGYVFVSYLTMFSWQVEIGKLIMGFFLVVNLRKLISKLVFCLFGNFIWVNKFYNCYLFYFMLWFWW